MLYTPTSIITFKFHVTIAQYNGRLLFFLLYFIRFLRKLHTFRGISKYMIYLKNSKDKLSTAKFPENFHTSESDENWFNEVFVHAEHESGISFVIIIIFGFFILWPVHSTRIEVEMIFFHFTT